MKAQQFIIFCYLLSVMTVNAQNDHKDYMRKVLSHLEEIESATYYSLDQSWEPGDTTALTAYKRLYREYNNPKDTTIGASFVTFDGVDTQKAMFGYDGNVRVMVDNDAKTIVIDDFTVRLLPFRPLSPPFFNYTKSIIKYALETSDNIAVTLKEETNDYYIKIVIEEEQQVEFFGKAFHLPENPYCWDPTSIYELWISKTNDLPYKVRREMSTNISMRECSQVQLNNIKIENFELMTYFPQDYTIQKYGEKRNTRQPSELISKKAPDWTLINVAGEEVALSDFKSKVLLIQLTGIGCGPCKASIPFLNKLKSDFAASDLELIAIETWVRKSHSLQNYINRYGIKYLMLSGTDEIIKDYQTSGAVPVFFVLDEKRIIRNVFNGYGEKITDQAISDAIRALIP